MGMQEDNKEHAYNFSKWSTDGLSELLKFLEGKKWKYQTRTGTVEYKVQTDEETFRTLASKDISETSEINDFLHKWEMYHTAKRCYEEKTGEEYAEAGVRDSSSGNQS